MKRYLLSILLAVFAIGGIGTYYAFGMMKPLPDFRLEMTEGNGRLLEKVAVTGHYDVPVGSEFASISIDGTAYDRLRTVLGRREVHALADGLERKHRSFLRGKYDSPVNFYQDETHMVYAELNSEKTGKGVWEVTATVDMLDLQSGARTTFRVVLDDRSSDRWPYLADVQLVDGNLHLFTVSSGVYRDFVVTADGHLVRVVDVATENETSGEEGEWVRKISLVTNHRPHAPKEMVGYHVRTYVVDEAGNRQLQSMALHEYRYREGESRFVATFPPEDALDERPFVNLMTNDTHNVAFFSDDTLRVNQVRLADGALDEWSVDVAQLGGERILSVFLSDEHAYVLLKTADGYAIKVVDPGNGSVVAAGVVKDGKDGDGSEMARLYLFGVAKR